MSLPTPTRLPGSEDPTDRIRTKRVYDPPSPSDGKRILVDRLWPRGVSKDRAHLDQWCKDIAPSDALRHWFHADPSQWEAFEVRYQAELATKPDLLRELASLAEEGVVTLLFASREEEHNNATVLADVLREAIDKAGGQEPETDPKARPVRRARCRG